MAGKSNNSFVAICLNNFYLFRNTIYAKDVLFTLRIFHILFSYACGVIFDEIIIFTKADAILSPYNPLECLLFYLSRCSVRNGIARD